MKRAIVVLDPLEQGTMAGLANLLRAQGYEVVEVVDKDDPFEVSALARLLLEAAAKNGGRR